MYLSNDGKADPSNEGTKGDKAALRNTVRWDCEMIGGIMTICDDDTSDMVTTHKEFSF